MTLNFHHRLPSTAQVNMSDTSVLYCPTVPLSNGLQIPIFGLGMFYFGKSWTCILTMKQI